MKFLFIFIILSNQILLAQNNNTQMLKKINQLNHFVFGSCQIQFSSQKYWLMMRDLKPNLVIMGGDNVYADSFFSLPGYELDYRIARNKKSFVALKKTTPLIGIWDDHDYGENNGGSQFNQKEIAKALFLDLIQEEVDSPRRYQKGIYYSYDFGQGSKKVKIILLDNRYFKDGKTILGDEQWNWLENQLKNSDARQHVIMSGISLFHPKEKKGEEWESYPAEKEKLLSLLVKYNTPGVLFLTGDKHFSAFLTSYSHGKTWYEFLSSGLTHSIRKKIIANKEKIFRAQKNISIEPYFKRAFGEVLYDWQKKSPILTLNIRSATSGKIVKSKTIKY